MKKHFSARNAFIATRGRKCQCRAYLEIFSKGHWLRLKFIPREGEKPTLIRIWHAYPAFRLNGNYARRTTEKFCTTAQLFCQCQMEPIASSRRHHASQTRTRRRR